LTIIILKMIISIVWHALCKRVPFQSF
jgi:hypothetical protein